MLVIRLQRGGRVHRPIYKIVATDSRNSRDGRFLEILGQYDPQKDRGAELSGVKAQSIRAWVQKGAAISDTVRTLLKKNKVSLS